VRNRLAAFAVSIFACFAAHEVLAQDFADPDTMIFRPKQKTDHSSLPEVAGTIESISTEKPGWYGVVLKLENGNKLRVVVVPATKFFKDYAPIDPPTAYPQLVNGCKIRTLHDPENDQLLRNIIVTDLMFETPPVEFAGVIKIATTSTPDVYDLTVKLEKDAEHHLHLDPKTKFWKNDKPLEASAAYPQLLRGQKIRALEKPAPGGAFRTSDLMFVDR
jgi:hypothetical protein